MSHGKGNNKKQTTLSAYITNKVETSTPTFKRTSSNLSPSEVTQHSKKPNMDTSVKDIPEAHKGTTNPNMSTCPQDNIALDEENIKPTLI